MKGLSVVRMGFGAAALSACALLVAGPALSASPPPPPQLPSVFAGLAAVSGLFEQLDSAPSFVPTDDPIYANFADGASTYASQALQAQASPYDPGPTIVGLPGLLCEAGATPECETPPLPFLATANQQVPNASVSFAPSAGGIGLLSATAHATLSGVSTTSTVAGLDQGTSASPAGAPLADAPVSALRDRIAALVGHPMAASNTATLSIGTIQTTTQQSFSGSTLDVQAEATDSGVSLLGGLINIGAIVTTSKTATNGGKIKSHVDKSAITGVTVAGLPATINQDGITVDGAGDTTLTSTVNSALQQGLSAAGIQIHLAGDTTPGVLEPGMCASGEADGLIVSASANLTAIPIDGAVFFQDLALGSACTTGDVGPPSVASPGTSSSGPPSGTGLPSGTGPSTGGFGGGASGSYSPGSSPSGLPSTGTGATPTSPLPSGSSASGLPASAGGSPGVALGRPAVTLPFGELGSKLVTDRLSLLYLTLGLAAVAVLLGALPLLKPRLPRGP